MEECKGGDLFDKIVNNGIRLPEDRAREIVSCLLDAIAYLHERDIVHRDLKVSSTQGISLFYRKYISLTRELIIL